MAYFGLIIRDKVQDMLCKSEVTAVWQECGTVVHVAKSGFDSHILSFLCLKMAGVIAFDHLSDTIIKYVRCKKKSHGNMGFFVWEENEEENPLLASGLAFCSAKRGG